jgi:hypothetical protein
VDVNPTSGSVLVDTTHVHSGAKALKLATPVGGNRAFAVLDGPPVFPAPVNNHYGRMWIWISTPTGATNSFTHIDNIEATGTIDGTSRTKFERVRYGEALYANDTHPEFYANLTDDSTIDAALANWNPPADPVVHVPLQTWACFEWHFGGPAQIGDFWLNGTRIGALSPPGYGWNSTWQYPLISSVALGWQAWGTLPVAMTVWVDDVAIGTSQLGCQ